MKIYVIENRDVEALKIIGCVKISWDSELTDFGRATLSQLRADEWR